ncbi:hypothetical protein BDB13_2559 [Rhodococcus sp. OK302]|nr:hypothetical protein BDB13_2559 [Rhodococcus sp. OK302]
MRIAKTILGGQLRPENRWTLRIVISEITHPGRQYAEAYGTPPIDDTGLPHLRSKSAPDRTFYHPSQILQAQELVDVGSRLPQRPMSVGVDVEPKILRRFERRDQPPKPLAAALSALRIDSEPFAVAPAIWASTMFNSSDA